MTGGVVDSGDGRYTVNFPALGASGAWHALLEKITDCVIDYGRYQIESGVSALQLFDSWVGTLSPADYSEYVMPHTMRAFRELSKTGAPAFDVTEQLQ